MAARSAVPRPIRVRSASGSALCALFRLVVSAGKGLVPHRRALRSWQAQSACAGRAAGSAASPPFRARPSSRGGLCTSLRMVVPRPGRALTPLTAITVGGARAGRSWLGAGSSAGSGIPGWASAAANASIRFYEWWYPPFLASDAYHPQYGHGQVSRPVLAFRRWNRWFRKTWVGREFGWILDEAISLFSFAQGELAQALSRRRVQRFLSRKQNIAALVVLALARRGRIQLRNAALPPLCGTASMPGRPNNSC